MPTSPNPTASWEQRRWTSRLLHTTSSATSQGSVGVAAASLVAVWVSVGAIAGFPDWWATVLYSTTCSVTFVMVFVIQHTQERQTAATQRKLDELIRATSTADDHFIAIERDDDDRLSALAGASYADRERADR